MNRNAMKLYERCVQEDIKLFLGVNEAGPNVGSVEAKHAFFVRPVAKHNTISLNSELVTGVKQEYE